MKPDYEILSAYLDGQVTGEERARVERLLAEDAEARQVLEELREVSQSVAGLPRHALPDDFAKQIEASLEARPCSLSTDTEVEGKVDWRYLQRRFLSGRSIAWVATVLLVALAINYLSPNEDRNVQQVARDMEVASVTDESASLNKVSSPKMSPSISAVKVASGEAEESSVVAESLDRSAGSDLAPSGEAFASTDKQKTTQANETVARKGRSFVAEPTADMPASLVADSLGPAAPGGMSAPASAARPEADMAKSATPTFGMSGVSGPGNQAGGGGMMAGGMADMSGAGMMGPTLDQGQEKMAAATKKEDVSKTVASPMPLMESKVAGVEALAENQAAEKTQAVGQVVKPQEIIVICEVKKPAYAARDFDRLLVRNHVVSARQILLDHRSMSKAEREQAELLLGMKKPEAKPPAAQPPSESQAPLEPKKVQSEEELVLNVNWAQVVGLLQAVQQDVKQFVSVQADASPGLALPESLTQFNRVGDKDAPEMERGGPAERGRSLEGNAIQEYNRRVEEAKRRAKAALAPQRMGVDQNQKPADDKSSAEYQIRFIFRSSEDQEDQ